MYNYTATQQQRGGIYFEQGKILFRISYITDTNITKSVAT